MKIKLENGTIVDLDRIPNECPWCHRFIEPKHITTNIKDRDHLELVYRCSNFECFSLFISSYIKTDYTGGEHRLERISVGNLKNKNFSETIHDISPSFVRIFNQAFFAEQRRLFDICGVGFRKALEFLIKDYLILSNPGDEEKIKKSFLGNCIKNLVDNEKIKIVAKRAVWLGNDETHYIRKWENKDLGDLKKLIELTVLWIEMEKLTESLEHEMPD